MRYILLLLILGSCTFKDCKVSPNMSVNESSRAVKTTSSDQKNSQKGSETDNRGLFDIQDLKDKLTPGSQFRCVF
jgi:hypothetical protein